MPGQSPLRPILVRMLEGRVGSTLVMQLLGSAPEIAFDRSYPFENSYLTYLTLLIGRISAQRTAGSDMSELLYGNAGRVGPVPFESGTIDLPRLEHDSLAAVWQAFATNPGIGEARFYAEKFWGEVGPLIAAGLDPVVIDLVRDPRDIVASVRAFNEKTGRPRFGRAEVADDRQHLRRLTAGMALRLQTFAEPLPVARLELRYEDLVSDLDGVAARLSALIGVELDPAAVRAGDPDMARHMTAASAERSIGRWRTDLDEQDVAAIERRLGRHMARLGYPGHEHVDQPM